MNATVEALEKRQLLSGSHAPAGGQKFHPLQPVNLNAALSATDVGNILGRAASQAMTTQAVAVTDRSGNLLGLYEGSGLAGLPSAESGEIVAKAIARARTVAFFESSGEAFTTRTARFIIQDHFPWPIKNTPGGPLYGVEFSSLIGSDILPPSVEPAITGDPGGIPLFIGSVPAGGVGVAGDFHDIAVRPDINLPTIYSMAANPKGVYFNGQEEHDFDEAVAMAGAQGFAAPQYLRANHILVAGLRFPFSVDGPAHRGPSQTLTNLLNLGAGTLEPITTAAGTVTLRDGEVERDNYSVLGEPGLLREWSNRDPVTGALRTDPQTSDPIRGGTDAAATGSNALTASDVQTIFENAVRQALNTRAGIRKPNGVNAEVHISVVDTNGNVLGVFRMHDGTDFSYDVAVQKARTAMYFSDNQHALSARAVGFMSQYFFPPGIPRLRGPLYHLQNSLEVGSDNLFDLLTLRPGLANTPLKNGITIFPGGFPLYKNGVLVGGIGISGDGVDQDDLIGYAGTLGFRPSDGIRSDQLSGSDLAHFILNKVTALIAATGAPFDTSQILPTLTDKRLRLPYTKFPRNPEH